MALVPTQLERSVRRTKVIWCVVASLLLIVCVHPSSPAEPDRIRTIGYLAPDPASYYTQFAAAFRAGLRDVGYIEGQNLIIEWRYGNNDASLLPALAAELVRLKVEVLVADGT